MEHVWIVMTWELYDDACRVEGAYRSQEGARAAMEALGMVVTERDGELAGDPVDKVSAHRKYGSAERVELKP